MKSILEKARISIIKKVPEGRQEKTLEDFLLNENFKNDIGDALNTCLL